MSFQTQLAQSVAYFILRLLEPLKVPHLSVDPTIIQHRLRRPPRIREDRAQSRLVAILLASHLVRACGPLQKRLVRPLRMLLWFWTRRMKKMERRIWKLIRDIFALICRKGRRRNFMLIYGNYLFVYFVIASCVCLFVV